MSRITVKPDISGMSSTIVDDVLTGVDHHDNAGAKVLAATKELLTAILLEVKYGDVLDCGVADNEQAVRDACEHLHNPGPAAREVIADRLIAGVNEQLKQIAGPGIA